MYCELCGKKLRYLEKAFKIVTQLGGETKELYVCGNCKDHHEKELELTRQDLLWKTCCDPFGDEPKVEKKPESEPTYDYLITFDMVNGHSYMTTISNQPEAITEFMEKMVNKPYASILLGDGKLVCINLRNVTKINVSLKEKEE